MVLRNYITEFVKIILFLFSLVDCSHTIYVSGSISTNRFVRFHEMIFCIRRKYKRNHVEWEVKA